jgi:hypothetical protein
MRAGLFPATGVSMGDSAEGLVDAESRIQERMDEREQQKKRLQAVAVDPERVGRLESLRLAKTELERQLARTIHAVRREQIVQALAELGRRIDEA